VPDQITDSSPASGRYELTNLSTSFDRVIPAKHGRRNMLIGTWNERSFDRITREMAIAKR
jgi:hypothetical protein